MSPLVISGINAATAAAVVGVVAILFLSARLTPALSVFDPSLNPNTATAALLWGVWWLTLLQFYLLGNLVSRSMGVTLLCLDVGNMGLLGAAVALSQGADFRPAKLWPLVVILVFLSIWDLGFAPLTRGDALSKLIGIAPSAVLSHVSILALGWMFVVRWGIHGTVYFVLTIVYALLQLPAYYADHFHDELRRPEFGRLVFLALAVLKPCLAFGFFAFLISGERRPNFAQPQYWPANSFPPNRLLYASICSLALVTSTAVVSGVIGTVVSSGMQAWVKVHFPP